MSVLLQIICLTTLTVFLCVTSLSTLYLSFILNLNTLYSMYVVIFCEYFTCIVDFAHSCGFISLFFESAVSVTLTWIWWGSHNSASFRFFPVTLTSCVCLCVLLCMLQSSETTSGFSCVSWFIHTTSDCADVCVRWCCVCTAVGLSGFQAYFRRSGTSSGQLDWRS